MGQEDTEDVRRPLPPNPPNEDERLKVSAAVFPQGGLGDGAPEDPMLQSMCKTICKLFNVPIAGEPIALLPALGSCRQQVPLILLQTAEPRHA